MGDSELGPWGFYTTGGFFVLLGWVIGVTDQVPGNVLLAVGFVVIALGIWVAVVASKKRHLEQQRAEKQRIDDEREREVRLVREKEVADKWWKDHHRGLWDPTFMPKPPRKSYSQLEREEASVKARQEFMELLNGKPVKQSEQEWVQNRVRPLAQKYGVSHKGAEALAAEWLRFLGEYRVEITPYSQDGGADVLTASYCCQVKNYEQKPVSVVEVRALLGAAVSMSLKPLLFTASKPTNAALIFCKETDIAVVEFDATNALLFGLTAEGHNLLRQGRY
jgi:hypothetical protein